MLFRSVVYCSLNSSLISPLLKMASGGGNVSKLAVFASIVKDLKFGCELVLNRACQKRDELIRQGEGGW